MLRIPAKVTVELDSSAEIPRLTNGFSGELQVSVLPRDAAIWLVFIQVSQEPPSGFIVKFNKWFRVLPSI